MTYLIIPDSEIAKEENHKQLTVAGYSDFLKLMILLLSYLNEDDYQLGRLLTLGCFSYYKIEKETIKYIYEDLISDIYPCKLWFNQKFWEVFFYSEVNDSSINECIVNDIKYEEDNEEEKEAEKKEQMEESLITTCDIMLRLNLNRSFIKILVFSIYTTK